MATLTESADPGVGTKGRHRRSVSRLCTGKRLMHIIRSSLWFGKEHVGVTRSQLRVISRILGVLVFGVCFVLVLDRAEAGSKPAPAPPQPAPAADASVSVPAALAGPHAAAATASAPFTGLPSVGAIFTVDQQGRSDHHHYCTGSVVDSPGGDVIATAAHCVESAVNGVPTTSQFVFVPGYHDGVEPYGEWTAVKVLVDPHWSASNDPDYDVAFVVVQQPSTPKARLADLVGAQHIGFSPQRPQLVGVIGYPTAAEQPVACLNTLKPYAATQSEFDCVGFADGSSGGPVLTGIDAATGRGTLVGVIGGYQEGGDTPDISYASYFGGAVKSLYQEAEALG
ncbi:V8-like Glu-specific endopeptidase [Streptacidiphilus sp. MAP12-16]